MRFWRQEYFRTLKDLADEASACPEWQDYAQFCLCYEQGLRERAFTVLDHFITSMKSSSFTERKHFVSWLMLKCYEREGQDMAIPHPLKVNIVEPTLLEWTLTEPDCSEPHRWLGGYEHLNAALELNPKDHIARKKFIICLLSQVSYATHELPRGYLGSATEDLAKLDRVEALLEYLPNHEDRKLFLDSVSEERAMIHEYLGRQ